MTLFQLFVVFFSCTSLVSWFFKIHERCEYSDLLLKTSLVIENFPVKLNCLVASANVVHWCFRGELKDFIFLN